MSGPDYLRRRISAVSQLAVHPHRVVAVKLLPIVVVRRLPAIVVAAVLQSPMLVAVAERRPLLGLLWYRPT
jgi:hypothetical protein